MRCRLFQSLFSVRRVVSVATLAASVAVLVIGDRAIAQSSIAFVQVNYATPQSAQTTVAVPFVAAQTAGNLNVVVVGWNDSTAQVQNVSDTKGNVYAVAVGPTV